MWATRRGRESCTNPLTDQGASPHLICFFCSPHLPKEQERKVTNIERGLRKLAGSKRLEVAKGWEWDGGVQSTYSWASPGTGKVAQRLQRRPGRVSPPL